MKTVLVARGIHFNQVGSFAGYDWLATVYGRDDIEIILKDTGDLASSREDARVRYKMGPQSLSVKLLEMSHGGKYAGVGEERNLQIAIEEQPAMDKYLMEISLHDLETTPGEYQAYSGSTGLLL
eukprot:scaffold7247_cov143-Skeletonema_menzelii.AAC.3